MEFEHWDKLIYGINRGECILFLGPNLPIESAEGKLLVPAQDLATRLFKKLTKENKERVNIGANQLAQISQRFLDQEDEVGLEMEISKWHEDWREKQSTLHDDLAALQFRYIISSSHSPLMETGEFSSEN